MHNNYQLSHPLLQGAMIKHLIMNYNFICPVLNFRTRSHRLDLAEDSV